MAILFSQSDGSDQHYDTYEEFEQAMILMKRLNGEEVPKDLLDEVKAKNGGKETKPIQVQINGINFESAIREEVKEETRELAEALDEVAKDVTPESDECEVPEKTPKFEVGDKVKVVNNTSSGHVDGTVGEISEVRFLKRGNRWSYEVRPISDYIFEYSMRHRETDLELLETCDNEFKVGDKVRVVGNDYGHYMDLGEMREIKSVDSNEPKYRLSEISTGFWASTSDIEHVHSSTKFGTGDVVKVTESFVDILGDRAICGAVYNYDEDLGLGETFVGTVLLEDNVDKLELVCRAENRLDK